MGTVWSSGGGHENERLVTVPVRVITSYSIHYTKLYDEPRRSVVIPDEAVGGQVDSVQRKRQPFPQNEVERRQAEAVSPLPEQRNNFV